MSEVDLDSIFKPLSEEKLNQKGKAISNLLEEIKDVTEKEDLESAYDFESNDNGDLVKKSSEVSWTDEDYQRIFESALKASVEIKKILNIDSMDAHPLLGVTCMQCGFGIYKPTTSRNLRCDKCGVIQRGYVPLPAYIEFHKDRSKYKGAVGAYGAAKTTSCINEDIEMAMKIPKLNVLIGTGDLKQLAAVAIVEFLTWCPEEIIEKFDKTNLEIVFKNGSRIYFRPLYDQEKIKSLTLARAHIIETSSIKDSQKRLIFLQLQKRLRQPKYQVINFGEMNESKKKALANLEKQTKVEDLGDGKYKIDIRQIVMETNPEPDWFNELFMTAREIHVPDNSEHHNYSELRPEEHERNKFLSVWVFPSRVNLYLPRTIFEEWKSTLTPEEYAVQVEGSLKVRQFGTGFKNIKYVEPFQIPNHWKRVFATDSGIQDARTWGAAAIKPETGDVYIYGLLGKDHWIISEHAQFLKNHLQKLPFGIMAKQIQADKQLFNTRDNDKGDGFTSTSSTYAKFGVMLTKAVAQDNASTIEQGLSHINDMTTQGIIHIFKPSTQLLNDGFNVDQRAINDIAKYVRDKDGKLPERRGVDFPDTLRYLVGPLPTDRKSLMMLTNSGFIQDAQTGQIFKKNQSKAQMILNGALIIGSDPLDRNNKNDFEDVESIFGI